MFINRDKKQLSLTVTRGFCYLVRYHLGTVAFGALIIGIVRLIRAIISFVQKRLKRYDNDLVRGILWCCQCCLWCFECALKFLTRNAYIETGIQFKIVHFEFRNSRNQKNAKCISILFSINLTLIIFSHLRMQFLRGRKESLPSLIKQYFKGSCD